MANSRQKGRLGETKLAKILSDYSGLEFTLVPGSGSGKIKGDITCPNASYCIEVKSYAETSITDKMLTNSSNSIIKWWPKIVSEAARMGKIPLLVVKYNRSKWFVITNHPPISAKFMYLSSPEIYIVELMAWLESDKPKFNT